MFQINTLIIKLTVTILGISLCFANFNIIEKMDAGEENFIKLDNQNQHIMDTQTNVNQTIDISDLLKVDNRLPYKWRDAEVIKVFDNNNKQFHYELIMKFPNPAYEIDVAHSVIENNIWKLCIQIPRSDMITIAVIKTQQVTIPKDINKIVIGTVITKKK